MREIKATERAILRNSRVRTLQDVGNQGPFRSAERWEASVVAQGLAPFQGVPPIPAALWYPGGTPIEALQFAGYRDVIFGAEL